MLPQELRPEEQQGSSQTRTWDRSGADAGAKALRLEDAQAPEDCEGSGGTSGGLGAGCGGGPRGGGSGSTVSGEGVRGQGCVGCRQVPGGVWVLHLMWWEAAGGFQAPDSMWFALLRAPLGAERAGW